MEVKVLQILIYLMINVLCFEKKNLLYINMKYMCINKYLYFFPIFVSKYTRTKLNIKKD